MKQRVNDTLKHIRTRLWVTTSVAFRRDSTQKTTQKSRKLPRKCGKLPRKNTENIPVSTQKNVQAYPISTVRGTENAGENRQKTRNAGETREKTAGEKETLGKNIRELKTSEKTPGKNVEEPEASEKTIEEIYWKRRRKRRGNPRLDTSQRSVTGQYDGRTGKIAKPRNATEGVPYRSAPTAYLHRCGQPYPGHAMLLLINPSYVVPYKIVTRVPPHGVSAIDFKSTIWRSRWPC